MSARHDFAAAVFAVIVLASLDAGAAAPSFDCAKAGNWAEKQICKNDALAALDGWFGPLYGQAVQRLPKADADALRARRKEWLKARNACKDDKDGLGCLTSHYREFIAELEQRLAQSIMGSSSVRDAALVSRSPLDECGASAEAKTCLEGLLSTAETELANAETPSAGEGSAESNVAWRAYRNAECKRRMNMLTDSAAREATYSACLVELTRRRTAELQPR